MGGWVEPAFSASVNGSGEVEPLEPLRAVRDAPVGGQAVLEGVMMRGVSTWAVAVRKPDGEIEVSSQPLVSMIKRHRFYRLPLVRGVVALVESLKIGFKALGISANAQLPDEEEKQEIGERRLGRHGGVRRCCSPSASSSCCRPASPASSATRSRTRSCSC